MRLIIFTVILALPLGANTLPSEKRKNGPLVQQALSPVQISLQESSAVFYNNGDSKSFLYGTVVSEDGLILTKVSELDEVESFHVRVGTKKYRSPKIVARDDQWDVALVKIEAEGLLPVDMTSPIELEHGTWIVSNGATERRFRRARPGIVSANQREIPGGSPAVMGVALSSEDEILQIGTVKEDSGADKAGVKKGDEIVSLDGIEVADQEAFISYLAEMSPGEVVVLKVKRGEETLDLKVKLLARHKIYPPAMDRNDQLSGGPKEISARRTGFPMVFQHEVMLKPREIGGPVFTLDGEFVGMNIATANRVESFAIPVKELVKVLEGLRTE